MKNVRTEIIDTVIDHLLTVWGGVGVPSMYFHAQPMNVLILKVSQHYYSP